MNSKLPNHLRQPEYLILFHKKRPTQAFIWRTLTKDAGRRKKSFVSTHEKSRIRLLTRAEFSCFSHENSGRHIYRFFEEFRTHLTKFRTDIKHHIAWIWIWMIKRPGITSDGNFSSYLIVEADTTIFGHFLWVEMEIILSIHFYPPKYPHGWSQRHFMNKFHTELFFATSNRDRG